MQHSKIDPNDLVSQQKQELILLLFSNMFGLVHILAILSFGLVYADVGNDDPIVVGLTFLAESTDPTQGSTAWALTSHGIAEKLFTVDKYGDIVGQLATSVEKVSDFVWDVTLQPGSMFSDGTPVSADAVVFCLMEQNGKNENAQSSLGNMTVTAVDDVTVRIESEHETHAMDAVLAEWAFVVYTKDPGGNFVFTGPFVMASVDVKQMQLVPNEHYPGATQRPNVVIQEFEDGHALATAFKDQKVDIAFQLPIDTLPDLRNTDGARIKSFEVGYHYMMFYNTDKLTDVRIRKAIDLAIDRNALTQALAGGKGTRSLFPDNSPFFSDDSNANSDSDAAAKLLEEAGWTLNSSGKRAKDGKELAVQFVAYPHRPGLLISQTVIAEALTTLGITVTTVVTGQEWSETQQIIDERSFDLLMWAQHTLPAGDPLWFLTTFFRSDGSNNHANINSTTIDLYVDMLSRSEGRNERVMLTQTVQDLILEAVPVSNLVTPFWHVGLSERAADYEPWGSDYYVIRSDLSVASTVPKESSGSQRYTIDQGLLLMYFIIIISTTNAALLY